MMNNNSQCKDCIHNEICQFYNALGTKVICYPCGFYEAKEVIANSATTKEKQIEEMAKIIGDNTEQDTMWPEIYDCANALYNAGYRKQSEGEWIKHCNTYECSVCKKELFIEYAEDYDAIEDWELNFCPFCGARMKVKGGEKQ